MADKFPIDPKWDHLTQAAVRATNAGMTYGKYVAMEYEKRKRRATWEHVVRQRKAQQPEPSTSAPTPVPPKKNKLFGRDAEIAALLDEGWVSMGTLRAYCYSAGGTLRDKYRQPHREDGGDDAGL